MSTVAGQPEVGSPAEIDHLALENIKARAEVNQHFGKTASQGEAKATLKLIAALEAVAAEHTKELGGTPDGSPADICGGCPNYYPCPTIAAIAEALQ